jgi:hypothetical protein
MPSVYDVRNLISNQFGYSPRETLQDLDELIKDIENESWKQQLKDEKYDYAEKTGYCPKCYDKLEMIDHYEESSEYFGRPVSEKFVICRCPSCGYIKE